MTSYKCNFSSLRAWFAALILILGFTNGVLDALPIVTNYEQGARWSIGSNGKMPPVGNTVDVKNANWTSTIGDSKFGTVWADPDFDPSQKAFYYVRVLEIPTPPWYLYDTFRFGVNLSKDAPTSHQERAYTTPIWFTPAAG